MSDAPRSRRAALALAGVLLGSWFLLPVLFMWGAWEVSTFEPGVAPTTELATAAHVAMALATVCAFAMPLVAWSLADTSVGTRTLAFVQFFVACAAVTFFAIAALLQK